MAQVIVLSRSVWVGGHRFHDMCTALEGLAMREIPPAHPAFKIVHRQVRKMLRHKDLPEMDLSRAEVERLAEVIDTIPGVRARDELFIVSLSRLKKESGFDPMEMPGSQLPVELIDAHLNLRNAFGVVALAWQQYTHEDDMYLNAKDFIRANDAG